MDSNNSTEFFIRSISSSLVNHEGVWVSKAFDQVSYPKDGNKNCFFIENKSYWFNHRNRILKHIVSEHAKGKCFFDIGGGNGFVTKALQDMGFEAWLVEPGQDGCLNAKASGVRNIINTTFEGARFKNGMLDNIGLFDVLEHIKSDKETIKNLYQTTSPGGKIFITVPAYSFLWSDADVSAGHFRRYSRKSIRNILEKAGFDILYDTYFFSFLVPLIYIFRAIPYKVYKRKNAEDIEEAHTIKWKFVRNQINRLCRFEIWRITRKRRISFGSSCLIIAKKT